MGTGKRGRRHKAGGTKDGKAAGKGRQEKTPRKQEMAAALLNGKRELILSATTQPCATVLTA